MNLFYPLARRFSLKIWENGLFSRLLVLSGLNLSLLSASHRRGVSTCVIGIIFADGEQVKDDDGESGAGNIMLKILDQAQLHNRLIIVTRWYGGVHLGADRFRHVRTCVTTYLDEFCR